MNDTKQKGSPAKGRLAALLFIVGTALAGLHMSAQAAPSLKLSDTIESLSFSGDLRMREEYFDYKSNAPDRNVPDRSRQRYRLRFGFEAEFPNSVKAKFRLASGNFGTDPSKGTDQISTNQTFDNLGSKKGVTIDVASLEWSGLDGLKVIAGKMGNPLWRVYSSDLIWDDDFNPEGLAQTYNMSLFGMGRLYLAAMQMVADEESSAHDQYVLSEQVGVQTALPLNSSIRLTGGVHEWVNESAFNGASGQDFGQPSTNQGNRRSGSALANEFRILELTSEVRSWIGQLPLSIQGTIVKNSAYRNVAPTADIKADRGYQVGFIVGKASDANTWEAAYFNKFVQTDAVVADVADSDFGDGGLNRKGHIFWVGYSPAKFLNLKLKGFVTKKAEKGIATANAAAGVGDSINRYQLDCAVKF